MHLLCLGVDDASCNADSSDLAQLSAPVHELANLLFTSGGSPPPRAGTPEMRGSFGFSSQTAMVKVCSMSAPHALTIDDARA